MGLVSLILRIAAAIILFLLAFGVIEGADFFKWLAGALGLWCIATVFGAANFGNLDLGPQRRRE